jgi:ABC-type nitrate/sulfonate/bicarbonate transport system permease component
VAISAGVQSMTAERAESPVTPVQRVRSAQALAAGRGLRRITFNWPGVLTALAVWELLPRIGLLPAEYIPPASEVLPRFVGLLGDRSFWSDVGGTFQGWAMGLGISILLAVPLGLLIGTNPYLDRATRAIVEFLRPIPSVALLPLAILLLGISMDMKVFLVAFATFWPILVQAIYGVQDVDPVARDTARSFGLGRTTIFFRVTLPSAAPYLATGLRVASALGIILAITAELVAGVPGLGQSILLAQSGGANDLMYALILATGLISLALSAALRRAERHALRWHISHRGTAS